MTLGAIPEARAPTEVELEREEKFGSGRVVILAVDHGTNSQKAFNWALKQFLTSADVLHILHVVPKASGNVLCNSPRGADQNESPIYTATQLLFDQFAKKAYAIAKVKVVSIIRDGDAGKGICAEASRIKPAAVIMGSRGLGLVKSLLIGSATEYCTHHCPVPLVIVPHSYAVEVDEDDEADEADVEDKELAT